MRRLTASDAIADLIRLDAASLPLDDTVRQPAIANIVTVPPISLADPELDGSNTLLDANLMPRTRGESPRDLLIDKGETVDAPEGRIDDYRWKPPAKPAG